MGGHLFGNREIALLATQIRERPLEVEGPGVVGHGGNALFLHGLGEHIPVFGQDGVLGVDGGKARGDGWRFEVGGGQQRVVPTGNLLPQQDLFREQGKFFEENRGLERVETAVDPHERMLVFDLLAVDTDLPELFCKVVVRGEDGPTIPVAAQGLGREKGGAADEREVAGLFAVVSCNGGRWQLCQLNSQRAGCCVVTPNPS